MITTLPQDGTTALADMIAEADALGLDPVTRHFLCAALDAAPPCNIQTLCDTLETTCHPNGRATPQCFLGKLITLEGGDGSGKSSQAQLLAKQLGEHGIEAIATRAVGSASHGAEKLRALILNPDYRWNSLAEGILTIAVYREALVKVIVPALKDGRWVVCDRLLETMLVYLCDETVGLTQAVYRRLFDIMTADIAPGLTPDVTFLLDIPYDVAIERREARDQGRLDRNEGKGEAFHRSIFTKYRLLAKETPHMVTIDATQELANVTATMLKTLL